MNGTLAAALRLAELGWRLLPLWWPLADGRCACGRPNCPNCGKHPVGHLAPHGHRSASAEPAQLRAWWRAEPRANLALATGPESGVWALDLDGEVGRANLRRLTERPEYGPLPRTVAARSGSGSWHVFFAWPAGRTPRSRAVPDWPGVDVRGRGSSLTLAPSRHRSGQTYAWYAGHTPHERPLAEAPGWLLDLVDPPRIERPVPPVRERIGGDRGCLYGQAALRRAVDELTTTADYRNNRLNAVAYGLGTLIGAGYLHPNEVEVQLETAAWDMGLPVHEARATIASGLRAGQQCPRYLDAR